MATDLKQLSQLVFTEIRSALCELAVHFEGKPAVEMTSLRVRIGEPPGAATQVSAGEGGIHLPPELGWAVDMTFDPRTRIARSTQSNVNGGEAITDCSFSSGLFDTFPLDAIQGIGVVWKKKLAAAGFSTIGALCALERNRLVDLCRGLKSHRPIEFHAKALLSRAELPVAEPFTACTVSLLRLATMNETDVRALFGTSVAALLVDRLIDYCTLMVAILRDDVLEKTILASLVAKRQ